MADATHTTKFSRRTILAGTTAATVSPPGESGSAVAGRSHVSSGAPSPTPPPRAGEGLYGAPPPPAGDMLIALLAGEYRRVQRTLGDHIEAVEARDGMFAYREAPWKARTDALFAREHALVAEMAAVRPDSILGLAIKLRAAVFCEDDRRSVSCDERLLLSAMEDLDRMAEAALLG